MKFFIFSLCVLPLISGISADTSSICFVNYLKNRGFLGGNNGTPRVETPECAAVVESAKTEAIAKHRQRFANDVSTAAKTDCIIEKLQRTDFFDREFISRLDFSASEADDSTLAQSESAGVLTNMMNIIKSLVSCDVDSKFDSSFIAGVNESFYELFNKEEKIHIKADHEDFCVRKYVKENNLISFNAEKLKMNPRNVSSNGLNCAVIYKDYALKVENEMIAKYQGADGDKKWAGCFSKIIGQNHYVDQMQQFHYVRGLSLNAEKNAAKKEALRLVYIDVITNISKTAVRCHIPDGLGAL